MRKITVKHMVPKKIVKGHMVIRRVYQYIFEEKDKNITIFTINNNEVEYLSEIFACNYDYSYLDKVNKTEKYRNGIKEIVFDFLYENKKFTLTICTQRKVLSYSDDFVLFYDLNERDTKFFSKFLETFPESEVEIFFTSSIAPIDCTLFKVLTSQCGLKFPKKTLENMLKYYDEKEVMETYLKLDSTIYTIGNIEWIIEEQDKAEAMLVEVKAMNKSYATLFHIRQIIDLNPSERAAKIYGLFFTKRTQKIIDLEIYNLVK